MAKLTEINLQQRVAQQNNIQIYIPSSTKQNNYTHRAKLLEILSYLRVCCSIMPESQPETTNIQGRKHRSNPYFISLLKSLFEYDPEWWQKCEININGKIQSNDPIITKILQPLEKFHS